MGRNVVSEGPRDYRVEHLVRSRQRRLERVYPGFAFDTLSRNGTLCVCRLASLSKGQRELS